MGEFKTLERINLVKDKTANEKMIQEYIFNNPSVLGLGKLEPVIREKSTPGGGFVDMILRDEKTRYEVEIQLGATDPSHIIRTLEYWDLEKRRYPQQDHVAVIVAEEITGRFMNVIQLLNGHVPIIAIQMNAYKNSDDKILIFTKVLDKVDIGTEEDDMSEETDFNYWEAKQSNKKIIDLVRYIKEELNDSLSNYELNPVKYYIGLKNNGMSTMFVNFRPQKKALKLCLRYPYSEIKLAEIEKSGLEVSYDNDYRQFEIRISTKEEFDKHKDIIKKQVEETKNYYNAE